MKFKLLLLLSTIQFACHAQTVRAKNVFPDAFRKGGVEIGSQFPNIPLKLLDQSSLDTLNLENKVVYANYWFVGCRGCRQEEDFLKEIKKYFAGDDRVEFVSITPSTPAQIQSYFEKFGDFGFPVYLQEDFKELKRNFKVKTFPHNQIIVNGVVMENIQAPIAVEKTKDWMIKKIEEELDGLK